jgi:hypothetical protein
MDWTPEQRRARLDELELRDRNERCAAARANGDGCICGDARHAPNDFDNLEWIVSTYNQR